MIPFDEYHKDFDMLLTGNLGLKTTDMLVSKLNNSFVLINSEDDDIQFHYELIEYIRKNYVCKGKVANFELYKI